MSPSKSCNTLFTYTYTSHSPEKHSLPWGIKCTVTEKQSNHVQEIGLVFYKVNKKYNEDVTFRKKILDINKSTAYHIIIFFPFLILTSESHHSSSRIIPTSPRSTYSAHGTTQFTIEIFKCMQIPVKYGQHITQWRQFYLINCIIIFETITLKILNPRNINESISWENYWSPTQSYIDKL